MFPLVSQFLSFTFITEKIHLVSSFRLYQICFAYEQDKLVEYNISAISYSITIKSHCCRFFGRGTEWKTSRGLPGKHRLCYLVNMKHHERK